MKVIASRLHPGLSLGRVDPSQVDDKSGDEVRSQVQYAGLDHIVTVGSG